MATAIKTSAITAIASKHKNNTVPLIIIGSLFYIFGFISWVNGSFISHMKIACELEIDFQAYSVATAFFIAFAVMSVSCSNVAIMGRAESAATRISIMGLCNKIAGIIAGFVFRYIALKDANALEVYLKIISVASKNLALTELSNKSSNI